MRKSYALTHPGNVRPQNEDAFLCRDDIGLWVVADGMGGHEAGELASELVINALWNLPGNTQIQQMLEHVVAMLETVNRNLLAKMALLPTDHRLGSTLAALVITEGQGAGIWAGDSRIYRLRQGNLQRLTRDHSLVQELIDQGAVHPEQALNHPHNNVITRAIGVDEELELEQRRFSVEPEDIFLLCSDGLSNEVSDTELQALLTVAEPEQVVKDLLRLTLSRIGKDNITVLVLGPER